ncbi:hypothetical protein VNO80_03220 [Phaseolus coccineus]|uniref:Uncharacterized protein n=1 Tax=Phaseolus coccineus TaxID=3886 RepID=A0AAN9NVM3_PHACN
MLPYWLRKPTLMEDDGNAHIRPFCSIPGCKLQSNTQVYQQPTSSHEGSDHQIKEPSEPMLLRFQSTHSRSISDQLSSMTCFKDDSLFQTQFSHQSSKPFSQEKMSQTQKHRCNMKCCLRRGKGRRKGKARVGSY